MVSKKERTMGLWSAVSIGVGAMVGAGIFSIFGTAAQISGQAVYISFIIAGLMAFLSTYSYAKMSVKYPSAGGPAEFLIRGFGDNIITGGLNIMLWFGYIFGLALYAKGFSYYAMTFFPSGTPIIWSHILATLIVILFMLVNFFGAKAVGKSEFFIVTVKVGILFFFAIVGLFYIQPENLSLSSIQYGNMFFGAGMVFLAYQGFGLITNTAEDIKDPEKNLPRALYLSVVIVMVIYVLVSITVMGNLSVSEVVSAKDYALAAAARPFLGHLGFIFMAATALFSTSSAINASLYGGANISYILAKHGELPKSFDRKLWRSGTEGLFITVFLVLFFTNFVNLEGIGVLASLSLLIIYIGVNIAHLRLFRKTGANPLIIVSALIGSVVFCGVLVLYESTQIYVVVVFLVLLCLCFLVEGVYRSYTGREYKIRNNRTR